VGNLVLTRLLAPEAFGVMSMGYAVLIALSMLTDLGLEQSLVQRQRTLTPTFVNTVWSLQIVRGTLVGTGIAATAVGLWLLQWFDLVSPNSTFAARELPAVLAILALAPFISGFDSTNMALASRNMQVSGVIKLQFFDALIASIATMSIAWATRSVYAMPLGWIAGASFRASMSHLLLPGDRNRWCWDTESRAEIHGFGKWIFWSTAMTFVVTGGDRLLLGLLIDSNEMGLYAIAFLLASTAQTLLHKFNSVGLPLFSEVARERPSELRNLFHRTRLPIDLAALFIAGGLAGAAPLIVGVLYDPRYAGAAPMLAVLSLLVIATRYDLANAAWTALGKTKWLSALSLAKMLALIAFVLLGHHFFGTMGAIWGIALTAMVNHPFSLYFMGASNLLSWRKEALPLPAWLLGYAIGALANWALAGPHSLT
jgi:O-antigen/teichoic acid export membrane protein